MRTRRLILGILSKLFHALSAVLGRWKLLLLVTVILSPIGPHLRWSYSYRGTHEHRTYLRCTYLGSQGFVTLPMGADCPFITILDARKWK